MPKSFPSAWNTAIDSGSVLMATCVKVTFRSETGLSPLLGTTFDQDISFGGDTYSPDDGAGIEPYGSEVGTSITGFKFTGILGNRVTADQLRFLWQGAKIEQFNIIATQDPATLKWIGDASAGADVLNQGDIGQIDILSEITFAAEFRGQMHRATSEYKRSVCLTCPFQFGVQDGTGGGCPATVPTHTVSLLSVSADGLTLTFTATPLIANVDGSGHTSFTRGTVAALSGLNVGVPAVRIKSATQSGATATVVLADVLPYTLSPGDSLQVKEGCDRTFASCKIFIPASPGKTPGWPFGGFDQVPQLDNVNVQG